MLSYTKLNRFAYCGTVRASNMLVHILNIQVSNILYTVSQRSLTQSLVEYFVSSDLQGPL